MLPLQSYMSNTDALSNYVILDCESYFCLEQI